MIKRIYSWLFFIFFTLGYSQQVFEVQNFSEKYYAKVSVQDSSEVFTPGIITVYNKKTGKELVKVESEELAPDFTTEGNIKANILQLPYGEQSLLIYDDFNFDGISDLALQDGQNSCYHGPSYQIYLGTKNGFIHNKKFTRLAQEYCGMFSYNKEEKKIYTMTKSGCCWHQYSEFVIENNQPVAVKIVEEDAFKIPFYTSTIKERKNGKMLESSETVMDKKDESIKSFLSFTINKNNKQLILFNINNRTLNYAILKENDVVEFSYPIETIYQNPDFIYSASENVVSFKNKDAEYQIYDKDKEIGIMINIDGKTYNWKGKKATQQGSLKKLLEINLDNVVIK